MKRSETGATTMVFFITFSAVGCSDSSSNSSSNSSSDKYITYMSQGRNVASSQGYEAAGEKFEDAHDVKATSELKACANQADAVKDVQEETGEHKSRDALGELDKAANKTNGYPVMTKQATRLYKTISKVQDHIIHGISPLYKRTKLSYRDGDYQATVESCDQILDLSYINGKYYKKVKKNVKHLRKVANARLNGEDVNDGISTENLDTNDDDEATTSHKSTSSESDSSNNSSIDTNSSSSQNNLNAASTQNNSTTNKQSSHTTTSNSSANDSSNTSPSSNSDSGMMTDGQTVASRVIAWTRSQLSSLGIGTSSWSDQKIANFMRSAANSGHTIIDPYTKWDVENFQ